MSLYKLIDDCPYKRRREIQMVSAHRLVDSHLCAVCLSSTQPRTESTHHRFLKRLSCGHTFHPLCIDRWLSTHITCPLCRVPCYDPVHFLPLKRTFLFTAENHSVYNLDLL